MSTSFDIRQAIANQLRQSIRGLQAQPYVMAQPTPPSADVRRGPLVYDQAMQGGVHTFTMLVRVYVADATDKSSQIRLDEYVSPEGDRSVKAAIESDTSLGGLVQDLHVTEVGGEQLYGDGPAKLLGCEWTVEIWL